MIPNKSRILGAPLVAAILACAGSASFGADALTVHGAVSATAATSDRYNYLGNTDGSLDLNVVEVVLNGAHRFDNGVRLSAQLYGYKLNDFTDLALDFAVLDYSFNEKFGVRAGRLKRPSGLYGDSQDIDIVRPFAFLPFDFYPKTLRPLVAGIDGAAAYGTLPLGGAGNLEYQLMYGWLPKIAADSPYVTDIAEGGLNHITNVETDTTWLVALFWNTPVEGLKLGVTYNDSSDIILSGPMKSSAELALAPSDSRATPAAFPAGVYDFVVAGKPGAVHGKSLIRWTASAEYTKDKWVFAAEYQVGDNDLLVTYPAPLGARTARSKSDGWYTSATYQATDRLQLGAYYSEGYADKSDHGGKNRLIVPQHTGYLKDTAAAAAFNLTSWWVLKGEVHFENGTRGITAALNGDAMTWKKDWTYYVLKSTVSF